ncbi:MAG: DUF3619 domain-containing protein [Betaproteobacteria bacterium HGW-Betaproteobacteria-22]|nr:MAG: DUF3619 domain-containing protein [Betaproteobacteria bacterium HGW-Betaproteobacteria-22]
MIVQNKTEAKLELHAEVEHQIAKNVVELLDSQTRQLNEAQTQRLLDARTRAVHHLTSRQAQLAQHYQLNKNGTALLWMGERFGRYFNQHRLFTGLLLLSVVLLTLFAAQQFVYHHIPNSDAFLLASELPPEAYADKGFNAWLDTN